jgi:tRNA(Ile)-lysidine synthase
MKALKTFIKRVAGAIERHGMIGGARRIGVAVSGGADSVCLLHILRELAPRWGLCLTVLHFDHQLRGEESCGDAEFVRELAAAFGLRFVIQQAYLRDGGNLEERARQARLAFYREQMAGGGVERVALGHTRSDQAETVLFRLLRGAGTTGLAGIRAVTSDGIVRPLIEVERAEVQEYLAAVGASWREDSTNASPRFARNRIRHELLPQLAREWNPEIAAALARTGEQAAADEEYWRQELDRLEAGRLSVEDGAVLLEAGALADLPAAAAGRLVRRAIEWAKGDLRGVDFCHVEEVLRLARSVEGRGRVQAHGLDICRSFNQIRVQAVSGQGPKEGYRIVAPVPGVIEIPGAGTAISLELVEKSETFADDGSVYNGGMGWVDWARVAGSLTIRSWVPGDGYQPVRSPGVKKLKTLFQLARIPSWERCHWPVLVDGDAIVWSRRFGAAAGYAAGPRTQTILRIRETETAGNGIWTQAYSV